MPDWKKIKAEYIRGGITYRQLATKYEVSFTNLAKLAKKEKWRDLRKQADEKASAKIIDSIASMNVDKATKIVTVADKLLDKIVELAQGPLGTKNIKELTSALRDLKDIKGEKSELDMREQEARIEKLRKDIAADEMREDKPCGVVLMPPITEELTPPEDDDG